MKPPICEYCNKDFRKSVEKGGLLRFKLSESEQIFNNRFKQKGFVGHSKGMAWFCGEHYLMAKKFTHLTLSEALKKMK